MVISCSVPTCRNRFQKGGDIQFHSFPLRREDMSKKWAEAIGRHDWVPTRNSFVCSQHFTPDDYQVKDGKLRDFMREGKVKHFLREQAVPSIFNPMIPRRKNAAWRQRVPDKRLPFILPSHLEISCTPSATPYVSPKVTTTPLLPTTLPSGVSIVPLKKKRPNPPVTSLYNAPSESRNIPAPYSNGSPHKKMRPLPQVNKNTSLLRPSVNTSVYLTSKSTGMKPVPSLNPIYQQQQFKNNNDSGASDDQNMHEDDEPRDFDVTQFLSISIEKPQEMKQEIKQEMKQDHDKIIIQNLKRNLTSLQKECTMLRKDLQKRDHTIKSMQYQYKEMRKKIDSISIKQILKDNFKDIVTFDILENYLNNTNLDSYEKRYSDSVKRFAMKLFESSPDAYAIVSDKFDLPHPANVAHWLRAGEGQDLEEIGFDLTSGSDQQEVYEAEVLNIRRESYESEELNIRTEEFAADELNIGMEPAELGE